MIGAEPHAVFAQSGARGLVETLDVLGDLLAVQHAERLDELEGDAAGDAGDVLGGREREQGLQQRSICALIQISSRACTASRGAPLNLLVGDHPHARPQHVVAGHQPADRRADPAQHAVRGQHEIALRRLRHLGRARVDLAGENRTRRRLQCLGFRSARRRIGGEGEAVETSDLVAFDDHLPGFLYLRFQTRVLSQPPHQHAGPPVHEALGETLVQRIRQLVLDAPCYRLPVLRVRQPVRPVRHERPGAHMGDPVRQRVDIAIGPVRLRDVAGKPVGVNSTVSGQESIEGGNKLGMGGRRDLPVVGDLAHLPQPAHRVGRRRHGPGSRRRARHVRAPGCPRRPARASARYRPAASARARPAARRARRNPARCCAIAAS